MGRLSEAKTGYELWLDREDIPVSEGYGIADVTQIPRGEWQRTGGKGAYIQLEGMQGVTGMYVAEIPAGGFLKPERHLYQEVIYVLRGRGSTQVWSAVQRQLRASAAPCPDRCPISVRSVSGSRVRVRVALPVLEPL